MDASERFVAWQRDYNHVSAARLRLIAKALREFGASAGKAPEDCDQHDFSAWMQALSATGLHPNTVRKNGNLVRPFFKWAWREGLIDAERMMRVGDVPNPRGATGRSTPRPYKPSEIEDLWPAIDKLYPKASARILKRWRNGTSRHKRVWRHAMGLQIEAIVHLALHAGLRREEIFRAEIVDIHPDNDYVIVRYPANKGTGATPKPREVPMTSELRRALAEWLEFRAELNPPHDRPWLVLHPCATPNSRLPSHPLAPMFLTRFSGLMRDLGRGWELHRLRHTCATQWLRANMDLEQVSRLLGHSNLQQTLAYAEIAASDIHESAKRVESRFLKGMARPGAKAADHPPADPPTEREAA